MPLTNQYRCQQHNGLSESNKDNKSRCPVRVLILYEVKKLPVARWTITPIRIVTIKPYPLLILKTFNFVHNSCNLPSLKCHLQHIFLCCHIDIVNISTNFTPLDNHDSVCQCQYFFYLRGDYNNSHSFISQFPYKLMDFTLALTSIPW